ncbi:MAG: hypothetical protein H7247_14415, partial [Polaromonas sp.]|nr:hypothetical protein [Gemmatimonadaceae bacterium]
VGVVRAVDDIDLNFVLQASLRENHITPSGAQQAFTYCLFQWDPDGSVRATA